MPIMFYFYLNILNAGLLLVTEYFYTLVFLLLLKIWVPHGFKPQTLHASFKRLFNFSMFVLIWSHISTPQKDPCFPIGCHFRTTHSFSVSLFRDHDIRHFTWRFLKRHNERVICEVTAKWLDSQQKHIYSFRASSHLRVTVPICPAWK